MYDGKQYRRRFSPGATGDIDAAAAKAGEDSCFDAFSSREPASTSLENALDRHRGFQPPEHGGDVTRDLIGLDRHHAVTACGEPGGAVGAILDDDLGLVGIDQFD